MSMLNLRRSQKQSGFTLLELLVVLAILGMFLGMLIPRLGGIVEDFSDTICDTNNKGIRYFTQAFNVKNGHLPNGLTNLIVGSHYDSTSGTVEPEAQVLADPNGATSLFRRI